MGRKRRENNGPQRFISLQVDEELYDIIEKSAKKAVRSLRGEVIYRLRQTIENPEEKDKS